MGGAQKWALGAGPEDGEGHGQMQGGGTYQYHDFTKLSTEPVKMYSCWLFFDHATDQMLSSCAKGTEQCARVCVFV